MIALELELFGVYVMTDLDLTWRDRFLRAVAPWDIIRPRDTAELAVRLVTADTARITVASTCRWSARRAAQLMAQAAGVPLVRSAVSWDRDMVEVTVPADSVEDVARLMDAWAWGLFLWAATRHPEKSRWTGVTVKQQEPESVGPRRSAPLQPAWSHATATAGAVVKPPQPAAGHRVVNGQAVSHQWQGITRPSATTSARSMVSPPVSAPRKGG